MLGVMVLSVDRAEVEMGRTVISQERRTAKQLFPADDPGGLLAPWF